MLKTREGTSSLGVVATAFMDGRGRPVRVACGRHEPIIPWNLLRRDGYDLLMLCGRD